MTLNDLELLSRYIVDNDGLTTDTPDRRLALADRVKLAKALLLIIPVARAADEWKRVADDPGAPVWKYTMKLDEAIDAMRAALEGK